jgi:hypothetical protein
VKRSAGRMQDLVRRVEADLALARTLRGVTRGPATA